MLIDANSNPKTGYNGADYDFYVESVAGKLSGYLYQLSSTGEYRLVGSQINYTQPFVDSNLNLGSVTLQLGLGSINYPTKYIVMFYSAESFKSNEVRQFTSWVNIPPPNLQITTSPSNIMIRQGEEQLIPARIKSTSGFSNDIINMTSGVVEQTAIFYLCYRPKNNMMLWWTLHLMSESTGSKSLSSLHILTLEIVMKTLYWLI